MANTLLTASWKKLLKENPDAAEAAPLTKALEEYGRAEGKGDGEVEALMKVVTCAQAAKKKNAKLKSLVEYLDDLIEDASKERAKAEKEQAEAEKEEDDDQEVGAALRKSLVKVKTLDNENARHFVLALGAVAGLVVAKRPPITRNHRVQAKEMRTGKGKLLVGRCYGENGKYIFEFEDKPAGGMTKVIKKAAKVHANTELRLKVRGGGVEIDDEADLAELTDFGTEEADPTDAGGNGTETANDTQTETANDSNTEASADTAVKTADASEWADGLARLSPAIKDALKAGGPTAQEVKAKFSEAQVYARKAEYGQALELLDEIESILGRNAPNGTPPTDDGPTNADLEARLKARFRRLLPATKAVLASPGDTATEVRRLTDDFQKQSANKDFKAAGKTVDRIAEATALLPAEPGDWDDFNERLNAASEDARAHGRAEPDDRADLDEFLAEAQRLADAGAFAAAHALLDRVEKIVAAGRRDARMKEMGEQIPEGAASSGLLDPTRVDAISEAWGRARSNAEAGAAALASALRSSPFDEVQPIAGYVDDLVSWFPSDLEIALDGLHAAAVDGDLSAIKANQARSKKAVRACLDYLNANKTFIDAFEGNPFDGVKVEIAGPLKQSLASVLALLK